MAGLDGERLGIAGNVVLLDLLLRDLASLTDHLHFGSITAWDAADVVGDQASLEAEAAAAHALVTGHLTRAMAGQELEGDAALAKIAYAECYHRIAAYGVDLSTTGYVDAGGEAALCRLRDSWLWSRAYTISGGSSEMMRNILAKRRLRLPNPRPT